MKHVPDWFPGAGFKKFAKAGRELFDIAVDGPIDHLKEALKVCPLITSTCTLICGLNDRKVNGASASVATSYFDRVEELAGQGFDESVIRAVTATTYIGETNRSSCAHRGSFVTPQQVHRIP